MTLFYQDFNEQFEGYTQPGSVFSLLCQSCFIRISMNNLKDIHNMLYTERKEGVLFYQDFNEQFEGYTQLKDLQSALDTVVLSGFQ